MLAHWLRVKRVGWGPAYKPVIIVATLALSVYLASKVSLNYFILFLSLLGALVFLHQPQLGPVALLIASLSLPSAIDTGTQTSLHAGILLIPLLIAVWMVNMLLGRRVRLAPSRVNAPAITFGLSAAISFLAGNLPWNYFASAAPERAQAGGLAVFVLSAGVFLLVGNQVKELRWLKALTGLFLGLGAVVVVGRVIPTVAVVSNWLVIDKAQGSLFWVWLTALAGGQALFNHSLEGTRRSVLAGLALATVGVGWFLGRSWASGWLPPMAALITLLWLRSWRLGLLMAVAGGAGLLMYKPGLPGELVALDQYSIDTRWVAWQIILGQILQANPLIGLGPANYYYYTPLYPILGWYVRFNSHNQYVDIVAQTGILGLVLFVWLMVATGRLGWVLRGQVGDGFSRGYVYGCLGGLAGTLVAGMLGDWFLPFVYNIGLEGFRASVLGWLFLGGLVALEQIARRQYASQRT